ncbi:hypothetical protein M2137_002562 [Parabacteroides sp. PFB2-10]|uniref:hypothetical protein n=1 Tax=Parabacteroides sp. PFB2-10 TaxID=1742405 RepID=UPI002475C586|nr:hypothetical protein [Parabacteroides sp. PFB2-10]MDH6313772.1 hypothetical protein [Parabacteroides sp. PFB2-10]MDL2244997.1 hypothetical protein [Parabacteroides sp. OttesenSCG-928-J18]
MQQKQYTPSAHHALRFRRWSRKGYAAFVSLHHTVNIGRLASRLADRLQVKQGCLHTLLTEISASIGVAEENNQEGTDSPEFLWQELLLWLIGKPAVQPIAVSSIISFDSFSINNKKAEKILIGNFSAFFM